MRNLTLADLAAELGVSRSTVSRALRDDPQIASATRERTRRLATRLGYRPNAAARALHRREAGTVGLLLPRSSPVVFGNPHFTGLLEGIAEVAEEAGYPLLLSTSVQPDVEGWLREGRVDGLIALGSSVPDGAVRGLNELVEAGYPLVLVHGAQRALRAVSIGANERAGVWQALAHLAELGHRRVAFLGGPRASRYARRRERAFLTGLPVYGLERDDALVLHGDDSREGGCRQTAALLATGVPFDALLSGNDLMALGAIEALHDAGRLVPDEVSVVGFDDIPLAALVRPALTTVRRPAGRIGALAMTSLLRLMRGEHGVESMRLATRLIVRESSAIAAGEVKA